MRQTRYGDVRARSPPVLRVRNRPYSPPPSHRRRGGISPPRRLRRDAEERRNTEHEMSPPQRHRREYSPPASHQRDREYSPVPPRIREHSPAPPRIRDYPPPPPPPAREYSLSRPHGRGYSPPLAHHHEGKQTLHSQPFVDSRNGSSSLGQRLAQNELERQREGLLSPLERRPLQYSNEHLQNERGLSVRSAYGDFASTRFQWNHLLAEKLPTPDVKQARSIDAAYGSEALSGRIITEKVYPGSEVLDTDLIPKPVFSGYVCSDAIVSDKYRLYDANATTPIGLQGDLMKYDKLSSQGLMKEGDKSKLSFRDDLSMSNRTPTRTNYHDRIPLPSEGCNRSSMLIAEGVVADGYGQLGPVRSYNEDVVGDYAYCERQRDADTDLGAMPVPDRLYYDRLASVREKYGLKDQLRSSSMDSPVNRIEVAENSGRDSLKGIRLLDDQDYAGGPSHIRVQDEGFYGIRTNLGYAMEVYPDIKTSHLVNKTGFEVTDGSWPCGDGLKSIPTLDHDQDLYETDLSSRHRFTPEDLGGTGQSERNLKRKHGFDKRRLGYNIGSGLYPNLVDTDLICGREDWIEDSDNSHLRKPKVAAFRKIQKRLELPRNLRMSPWVKNNLSRKLLNNHGSHNSDEDDSSGAMADVAEVTDFARTEPAEDSEEFKQQVNSAFLKFIKLLNESQAQRRKYTDQGRSGILKCGVCGRKSKEFVNTLSLAMHAFDMRASGLRAEHMGLHRALCLLMGWSSAAMENGTWGMHTLPYAEAAALRDDLIIWPSVVVIHNSSIMNATLDERVVLSVEGLQAILREMGLGMEAKVTRGKPANHSIMVVSFHPTFSGLLEAEKLHMYFHTKGRGRVEFDQINSSTRASGRTRDTPPDKVSVLYGYLGVAEDLDKLDYESKKRCVVRSRKEIQDIMDAQLRWK